MFWKRNRQNCKILSNYNFSPMHETLINWNIINILDLPQFTSRKFCDVEFCSFWYNSLYSYSVLTSNNMTDSNILKCVCVNKPTIWISEETAIVTQTTKSNLTLSTWNYDKIFIHELFKKHNIMLCKYFSYLIEETIMYI